MDPGDHSANVTILFRLAVKADLAPAERAPERQTIRLTCDIDEHRVIACSLGRLAGLIVLGSH
jgi:hypothetical protein